MRELNVKHVREFLGNLVHWYFPFAPNSNLMRAMHALKRF